MRLHCALRHCSDKKLLLYNIPHRHLRKYISRLDCQACLLSLGHQQYCTIKSTVSSSKQLVVNSSDLPGNRSKFEISTLVPSADATSIRLLFSAICLPVKTLTRPSLFYLSPHKQSCHTHLSNRSKRRSTR